MMYYVKAFSLIAVVAILFAISGLLVIQASGETAWEQHCARAHTAGTAQYKQCLTSYSR